MEPWDGPGGCGREDAREDRNELLIHLRSFKMTEHDLVNRYLHRRHRRNCHRRHLHYHQHQHHHYHTSAVHFH